MLKLKKLLTSQNARALVGRALAGTAAGALALGVAWAQTPPPAFNYARLHLFSASGQTPYGGVVLDTSGALYGVNRTGQVYKLAPPAKAGRAWTETVLHQFPAGVHPYGNLIFGANGVLYGVAGTSSTGPYSIFQLTPPAVAGQPWTEAVLYTFAAGPATPYLSNYGPNGGLYGTTNLNGAGNGTVFQLTPPATLGQPWTLATIYAFQGGADGSTAGQSLLPDTSGALYGVTFDGGIGGGVGTACGAAGCGAVFKLTSTGVAGQPWNKTTLYSFQNNGDGWIPNDVIFGPHGSLYGATGKGNPCNGGASCGVVFQLTPPVTAGGSWTETVVYGFQGTDGLGPNGLALGANGYLYGTSLSGGGAGSTCAYNPNGGCGTVWELAPPALGQTQWTETILHSFTGGSTSDTEGVSPYAATLGVDGAIYGATFGVRKPGGGGVVFELHH